MFDNIGTAIIQALGFFAIFGYFVFQLLSDSKKTIKSQGKSSREKVKENKDLKDRPNKKGLFGRKIEPKKEEVKPIKKGLFGKKVETIKVSESPKKKGWFR